MKFLRIRVTALCAACFVHAFGADNPEHAVAMVRKGLGHQKKNGIDAVANTIENRSTYFLRSGDFIFEAGIYKAG